MCQICREIEKKRKDEAKATVTVEEIEAEHKVKLERLRKDYHYALKRNSGNAHKHINALAFNKWESLHRETDEKKAKVRENNKLKAGFAKDMLPITAPDTRTPAPSSPDLADAMLLALTGSFKPGAVNEYVMVKSPLDKSLAKQLNDITEALFKDKPVLNKDREAAKAAAEEYRDDANGNKAREVAAPNLVRFLREYGLRVDWKSAPSTEFKQGTTAAGALHNLLVNHGLRLVKHPS